jgi:ribosomal protein S10
MTKFLLNSKINFNLNTIYATGNNIVLQKVNNSDIKSVKCTLSKVILKITSHEPISAKFIFHLAEKMNVNITSFINLKKKDNTLITVLSGPHIDKKSREQFCISKYAKIFIMDFTTISSFDEINHFKNFLVLKKTFLDYPFDISFTYFERENLKL